MGEALLLLAQPVAPHAQPRGEALAGEAGQHGVGALAQAGVGERGHQRRDRHPADGEQAALGLLGQVAADEQEHVTARRNAPRFRRRLQHSAVLFLGATNEPWSLDPAILRPGRFDERVYIGLPDLPARETVAGVDVHRFRLRSRPLPRAKPIQLLKYGEAWSRMVRAGSAWRPDIVHAHDLTGLPIGASVARRSGARWIYDAHELWCDPSYAMIWARWLFVAGLALERRLARRADAVITVSDGLADAMNRFNRKQTA